MHKTDVPTAISWTLASTGTSIFSSSCECESDESLWNSLFVLIQDIRTFDQMCWILITSKNNNSSNNMYKQKRMIAYNILRERF